jgi:hypothetical protein
MWPIYICDLYVISNPDPDPITLTLTLTLTTGCSGPRFVSSKQHLVQLCSLALISLHWYACATWLQSRLLAEGGRLSWVATVMNGSFEETTEAWPWPLWARYASSFARALNAVVGGEKVGGTHEEVTHGQSTKTLTVYNHRGCESSNRTQTTTLSLTLARL